MKPRGATTSMTVWVRAWFSLEDLLDELHDGGAEARKWAREGHRADVTEELADAFWSAFQSQLNKAEGLKCEYDSDRIDGLEALVDELIEQERERMEEETEESSCGHEDLRREIESQNQGVLGRRDI